MTAPILVAPTIRFQDGTTIAYSTPPNTLSPRYEACTEHRPACDCREAVAAEDRAELRGAVAAERKAVRRFEAVVAAARNVLAGHPTWVSEPGPNGLRQVGCACTGCQIVRAAELLPLGEHDAGHRDETDGLSSWQDECEMRWKRCVDRCPNLDEESTRVPGQLGFIVRDRGDFHDHLAYRSGELMRAEDPTWMPF